MAGPLRAYGLGRRPRYRWRVGSRADVHATLSRLWPYLSEPKREQALAKGYLAENER